MKKWSEICEDAHIQSSSTYKSFHRAIKDDRVKIVIDIPIEHYQDFRRHIEVPSLRGRRKNEDSEE